MNEKRVILADFDLTRVEKLAEPLRQQGFEVEILKDGHEVLASAQKDPPGLAVLEVFLPRRNGFEVLKALKEDELTASTRVIVLLDQGDTYGYHRARTCGADLILCRPVTPDTVAAEASRVVQTQGARPTPPGEAPGLAGLLDALNGRRGTENPLIEHISDPWTGLMNSAYTEIKLAEEFKKARRFSTPLSCVIIGLDQEETLLLPENAQETARLVNELAGLLLIESRDIDHLARLGRVEVGGLLVTTPAEGGLVMAQRTLASFEARRLTLPGNPEVLLTASAGVATYEGGGMESAEELLERAAAALSRSRQWGGNRCTAWTPEIATAPPRS